MKAADLCEGDVFRLPGQRKWRIAARVLPLPDILRKSQKPGVLVCLPNCSQMELDADAEVDVTTDDVGLSDMVGVKTKRKGGLSRAGRDAIVKAKVQP